MVAAERRGELLHGPARSRLRRTPGGADADANDGSPESHAYPYTRLGGDTGKHPDTELLRRRFHDL